MPISRIPHGSKLRNFLPQRFFYWFVVFATTLGIIGCGTTTQRLGTEQLLLSDAVDMAVSQMDFRPLQNQSVYLDTTYLQSIKGLGFVNAPYIISSLRQQLTAANCLLQETREEADIIVEARVGALGTDGHEVTYGLPQSKALASAASVFANAPPLPVIPELSVGRVDAQSAVAKLMVFAYDRQSRQPIWQSGSARAESNSRNVWVLGAGPFQGGTVHQGVKFAGASINSSDEEFIDFHPQVSYFEQHQFQPPLVRVAELPETIEPDSPENQ